MVGGDDFGVGDDAGDGEVAGREAEQHPKRAGVDVEEVLESGGEFFAGGADAAVPLRDHAGLTQRDIADKLGCTPWLRQWSIGESNS